MEKINWNDFKGDNCVIDGYRTLRANIFTTAMDKQGKVFTITGLALNSEQSKVCSGLAAVMAETGKKILLIDGNSTMPVQHMLFDISNQGLTDCLVNDMDYHNYVQRCFDWDSLDILPIGSFASNLSGWFCGENFHNLLRKVCIEYDYVLIELAPVTTVSDAVVVAPITDGVLLVVTKGKDKLDSLKVAKTKLLNVGAKVIGCIVNRA